MKINKSAQMYAVRSYDSEKIKMKKQAGQAEDNYPQK